MDNHSIFSSRIERSHFALVKGWLSGLDLSEIGERYLTEFARDKGKTDLRAVKTITIRAVLDMAAMARRHGFDTGTKRLIELSRRIRKDTGEARLRNLEAPSPAQLSLYFAGSTTTTSSSSPSPSSIRPSFEDFKNSLPGSDDFSDAELWASYIDLHPEPEVVTAVPLKTSVSAREQAWLDDLLKLVAELERITHKQIGWQDPVGNWFAQSLADHMTSAQMHTLLDLAIAITNRPRDWYLDLPGVGELKARRIETFARERLGDYEKAVAAKGLALPPTAITDSPGLRLRQQDLMVGPGGRVKAPSPSAPSFKHASAIERPTREMLSGEHGRLRSNHGESALEAENDYEAMHEWLSLKSSGATIKLYEREITRLIAWSIQVRGRALSSLSLDDALAYRDFLSAIPYDFLVSKGPREKLAVPESIPVAGFTQTALKPSSIKKSLVIINGFYSWLKGKNHVSSNPFTGVKPPELNLGMLQETTEAADETGLELARKHKESAVDRTLPQEAVDAVDRYLNGPHADKDAEFVARARFLFWFGTITGLRISEMALARLDHLEEHDTQPDGKTQTFKAKRRLWDLSVIGKKSKARQVPFPAKLMRELEAYLEHRGLLTQVTSFGDIAKGTYLVGGYPSSKKKAKSKGDGVRPQTIHLTLKELFAMALHNDSDYSARTKERLLKATTHWLRHTSATDAVARGVPLDVVSNNLGHSDLKTTSIYVQAERSRKMEEVEKLWE